MTAKLAIIGCIVAVILLMLAVFWWTSRMAERGAPGWGPSKEDGRG